MKFETLDRWKLNESDDPEDRSRKEVQVVVRRDNGNIFVRDCYYTPSGSFGQSGPTHPPDREYQAELIDALNEAYDKAEIYREAKKTLESLEISQYRIIDSLNMIDEEGDITDLVNLVEA